MQTWYTDNLDTIYLILIINVEICININLFLQFLLIIFTFIEILTLVYY